MNIEYLICEMFDDFCGSNLHRDQIVIRGVCSNVIDNLSTIIYVCFTDQISKKPSGHPPVSWLSHGWKIVFDEKFPNQTYIRLVWWFPPPSFAVNGFDQKPRKTTRYDEKTWHFEDQKWLSEKSTSEPIFASFRQMEVSQNRSFPKCMIDFMANPSINGWFYSYL